MSHNSLLTATKARECVIDASFQMISLALSKIWGSLLFGFILQVEVAFKRIGILKTECAVFPPLKSVSAMVE